MTCQIAGCDKTATVYATENAETVPMCSDCYGYLNTLGVVEYVGVIRSEHRPTTDSETLVRAERAAGPVLWRQIRRAIGV